MQSSTVPVDLQQEDPPLPLFDSASTHLIIGPSGAGKTTAILQMGASIKLAEDFCGFHMKKYKNPAIIPFGRTKGHIRKILDRLCLDVAGISECILDPGLMSGNSTSDTIQRLLGAVAETKKDILFIDGFEHLFRYCCSRDNNRSLQHRNYIYDDEKVAGFLEELNKRCQENGVAIVGSLLTEKLKRNHQIVHPRDRVRGAAEWSALTDDIVVIELPESDDVSSAARTVFFCLRHNQGRTVSVTLGDEGFTQWEPLLGRLDDSNTRSGYPEFEAKIFGEVGYGSTFETSYAVELCKDIANERSIKSYLARGVRDGRLRKIRHGQYQAVKPN
jgi:hypothetical protein